jgi:hypothetical protein
MNDRLAKGLFNTLGILREYLPEIVVGGGWAPLLTTGIFSGTANESRFLPGTSI